jgi:5-aminopentanamidase
VRVSLVVYWDLGFAEVAREAALGGADLILAPAAWREPWGPQYELSCGARALDSGVYVASANQLGYYGEALFVTPALRSTAPTGCASR